MPSFLSKVFGRKKDDKEPPLPQGRASDPSLLEGKFESVSPSATKFPEVPNGKGNGHGNGKEKEKEKDSFALFKVKSRPASPDVLQKRIDIPQLSLNLPGPKEDPSSRALGVVFEGDPDAQILLGDSVLGSRRLNPLETLILVRACSQAIAARGLETLGIMHPHWYSASPDIQRRLISLFIQSLAPKSPITTLSPTPSAAVSAFESEILSTRSPHDVAAVLRWGLRHLKLEGNVFGKEAGWYNNFFEAERASEYSPNAFSIQLPPQLPAAHLELLIATLEVLSALAAHAEKNGISGSKLSKFFGLWLLTSQRAEEKDNWSTFYARWERSGRILEHLFLSRIRDEASKSRMPTRLLELVRQYPYNKNDTSSPETGILSRPRFSTRQYDALFVQIETELSVTAKQPQHHPLRLIAEAFKAISAENSSYTNLWEIIKKAGTEENGDSPGSYPGLSHIFADETIRFLSLIPIDNDGSAPTSPTFNLFLPQKPPGASRRRSFSMSDRDKAVAAAAAASSSSPTTRHAKPATEPTASSTSPTVGTDWAEFSTTGFFEHPSAAKPLASTLLEKQKDTEVTLPRSSKFTKASPIFPRKSLDNPRSAVTQDTPIEEKTSSKTALVSITQLDEAFIDFWSDALLDSISSDWPAFIICKLKSNLPGVEVDGKKLDWLVIEQSFKRSQPPNTSQDGHSAESARRPRPSSPKLSVRSDMSSTRKRFSFFTSRSTSSIEKSTKGKKKAGHSPRVGEMGEVLVEEDEKVETVKIRVPSPKPKKSADVPRKSVDVSKKSGENRKANGVETPSLVAGAAAVVGAAAVGATVAAATPSSPETAKSDSTTGISAEEPSPPADARPVVEVPASEPKAIPPFEAEAAQVPTKVDAPQPEAEIPPVQNADAPKQEAEAVETEAAQVPTKVDAPQTEADIPSVQNVDTPKQKAEAVADTLVTEPTPALIPQAEIPASVISPEELVVAPEPTPELEVAAAAPAAVIAEVGEAPALAVNGDAPAVAGDSKPKVSASAEPTPAAVAEETSVVEDASKIEPPVEVEAPIEAETPVKVEAELETEAPSKAEIPAEAEALVDSETPTEAKVPAEVEALAQEELSVEPPPGLTVVEAPTPVEPLDTPSPDSQSGAEPQVEIVEEAVIPTPTTGNVALEAEDISTDVGTSEPVAEAVPAAEPVVHTEPLHAPENTASDHDVVLPAVPIIEAEPAPAPKEPVAITIDEPANITPTRPATPPPVTLAAEDAQGMPPAPESVVAAGETPGPQIALDTSEPAALAARVDKLREDEATKEPTEEGTTLTQVAPTDAIGTSTDASAPTEQSPETTAHPETTPSATHNDSHSIPERIATPPVTN